MQLGFVGINYKKAKMDIRDNISFTDAGKLLLFQKAEQEGIFQCMALSTCNRSEVYYIYEKEEQRIRIRKIYTDMFSERDLEPYLTELAGEEAVAYLFRIAAGLESLVLGEDQILGQVKEAMDYSRAMGYGGKELNKIVRDAVTCAKRIKTELKISEKALSVSSIGIRKLDEACGIAGKRILVIGSGKTAALALKYLYEYPHISVTACSRNYAHAKKLREEFSDLKVIPYESWRDIIAQCDIVVCATSSPHLIVRRESFAPMRNMAFLDLGAPRDIDSALAESPFITLINLDTLQVIADENQKERERLVKESENRIRESVKETSDWLLHSRMDHAIESLQQRCSMIVTDSYDYLNRKMELGPREQKLLKKTLNASLQRLLREPIRELKRLDCEEEQEKCRRFLQQLFEI